MGFLERLFGRPQPQSEEPKITPEQQEKIKQRLQAEGERPSASSTEPVDFDLGNPEQPKEVAEPRESDDSSQQVEIDKAREIEESLDIQNLEDKFWSAWDSYKETKKQNLPDDGRTAAAARREALDFLDEIRNNFPGQRLSIPEDVIYALEHDEKVKGAESIESQKLKEILDDILGKSVEDIRLKRLEEKYREKHGEGWRTSAKMWLDGERDFALDDNGKTQKEGWNLLTKIGRAAAKTFTNRKVLISMGIAGAAAGFAVMTGGLGAAAVGLAANKVLLGTLAGRFGAEVSKEFLSKEQGIREQLGEAQAQHWLELKTLATKLESGQYQSDEERRDLIKRIVEGYYNIDSQEITALREQLETTVTKWDKVRNTVTNLGALTGFGYGVAANWDLLTDWSSRLDLDHNGILHNVKEVGGKFYHLYGQAFSDQYGQFAPPVSGQTFGTAVIPDTDIGGHILTEDRFDIFLAKAHNLAPYLLGSAAGVLGVVLAPSRSQEKKRQDEMLKVQQGAAEDIYKTEGMVVEPEEKEEEGRETPEELKKREKEAEPKPEEVEKKEEEKPKEEPKPTEPAPPKPSEAEKPEEKTKEQKSNLLQLLGKIETELNKEGENKGKIKFVVERKGDKKFKKVSIIIAGKPVVLDRENYEINLGRLNGALGGDDKNEGWVEIKPTIDEENQKILLEVKKKTI